MNTKQQREMEHLFLWGDGKDIELYIKENKNHINDPCITGFTPLEFACKFLSEKQVDFLLCHNADIHGQNGFSNLINLTLKSTCHVDEKIRVLQKYREKFSSDLNPLQLAILRRETTLVSSIIDKHTPSELDFMKTKNDESLMHLLIKSDFMLEEMFMILKDKCFEQIDSHDHTGMTPFHYTVLFRRSGFLKMLIDNGADINIETYNAETPLHLVMKSFIDEENKLSMLIGPCKKQLNYFDVTEKTCFHWALIYKTSGIVHKLIKHGADALLKTIDGDTSLHLAMQSSLDIDSKCQLLLEEANCMDIINEQNKEGLTCLHLACRNGEAKVVKLLMQYGADPYVMDNRNKDAIYETVSSSTQETMAKLEVFIEWVNISFTFLQFEYLFTILHALFVIYQTLRYLF